MSGTEDFLAVLRSASTGANGDAAVTLKRVVAAWVERQRRRTEIAPTIG